MNFLARAFQRSRGTQPSVSASAVDGQTISTSLGTDRIDIRATALNRGGYAEAIGLDDSTVSTLAGDDNVRIHAQARGLSTNAWAMRNSSLDTGAGNDNIELRASTQAGAFDPAYGIDNGAISTGTGADNLRIHANARGNTTDTIAAYGALDSTINTGADDDRVMIGASAVNRNGYAEAIGLDNSSLDTESGDDNVRIHAHARGLSTNAWAMRNSSLDTGSGNDTVHLRASTQAGAFDPAYGALNSSVVLGDGQDSLHIGANANGNTTDTIAAFGVLDSTINTGADDDRVQIRTTAANRLGLAEAIGLDASSLETEGGDDHINLHAGAYGHNTQAQALHESEVITGTGADSLRLNAEARGNTTDTIAAHGALDSTINTGADDDRIEIRATASNNNGTAEALGLDGSDLLTEGGDDQVRIQAHASGQHTYAWALRNSSLDVGAGNNSIDLRASTNAFGVDPAYGVDSSTVVSGDGEDQLRIHAQAHGTTPGTIAAFGAVNAELNLAGADDMLEINARAINRRGTAEAVGLDASTAETGAGDDTVRIHAHANGDTNVAWALRDSAVATGSGHDSVEIGGNALRSSILTGDGLDTIRISGLETDQLHIDSGADDDVLTVDGGTRISFVSGSGADQLQLTRNYFKSLVEAGSAHEDDHAIEEPMIPGAPEADLEPQQQVVESDQDSTHGDALKFEDFTTGEGGDSINLDDILRGHGVGLRRDAIFADGFLSFQQQGNDSVLFFDADGADQEGSSETALVVFKDVQAVEFSSDNLDSNLIQQDDFLLSQAQLPIAMPAPAGEADADPITGLGADQARDQGMAQPAPEAMEMGQPDSSMALDLAAIGLEAPVPFAPSNDLEAGTGMTPPAVQASTETLNPVAASPSMAGPEAGSALGNGMDQATADVI